MKVILLFPPFEREINDNLQITTVKKYANSVPVPLSLTSVAASLEAVGHDVSILDANALQYTKEQIISHLKSKKPDIVGLTTSTLSYHQEREWIGLVKKELGIPIMVGGKHAWYYPKELLKNDSIDYVFSGEADKTIVDFMDAYEKGNTKKLKNIKGLLFKENGKIIDNGFSDQINNLDELPFPAIHMLPLEKYHTFLTKRRKFITMITTRGCTSRCTFCDAHLEKYRFRSAENVVEEMQRAYDLGVREIELYDSAFTINKKRAIEIAEGIKKRKLDLRWDIRTRVNLVNEEVLKALRSAGCVRVNYGLESGDPNILKNMKKDITLEQIERAILLSKKLGFEVFGYFILGCPGETEDSMNRTIALSKKYPFDYVQFTRMVALPRTELYQQFINEKKYDYWLEYTQGKHLDKQIDLVGTKLTDEQVVNAVKRGYKEFYFRPKQIIKTLSQSRSLEETFRYIKAGTHFLFKK
ncbi:MAG: B12-binding domain-containing radical SAM protein [Nanoarchaeota archaeon]|nr:B12-binding domain-containing radical SAM protein [Nanoarchaeota archaeon]